jgi:tetratricopeptide (TPR) repeat protein
MALPRRRRPGFIFIVFGSRNIISTDNAPPVETTCPRCGRPAQIIGRTYRSWFTLFFLPIFPLSGTRRFSQCSLCNAQFPVTLEELQRGLAVNEQQQNQQAISLYNSLRASPANSITLNQLMLMYASMNDFNQAISAANDFPEALNASEQCMSTLGRVYLAAEQRPEAIKWFDAALQRNAALGEAHYHKALALLTSTPPDYAGAVASARQARKYEFPNAEALVREAEAKERGE